jgi:hypothetical protein
MDHELNDHASPVKAGLPIHLICFTLGLLISTSALFWLLATAFIGPTWELVTAGAVQLAIGISLICTKWITSSSRTAGIFLACAIALLILNTAFAAWFGFASIMANSTSKKPIPALTASDPDSPIIVTIKDSRGLIQTKPVWSGTIYADGKRPTQYTGWPVELIGNKASPTKLVWHNDAPDWVEIKLDNGFSLKLTWNEKSAFDARLITDLHYFLDPKFEIVR